MNNSDQIEPFEADLWTGRKMRLQKLFKEESG